jgi:hypothetical protein
MFYIACEGAAFYFKGHNGEKVCAMFSSSQILQHQ